MIIIGADHGGFKLKEELKKYLDEKEIEYEDIGTFSEERTDYPRIAKVVCNKVTKDKQNKGILVCRSGYGMSIVANKFKGIRCAPVYNEESAKYSRMHNDINVLALGADYLTTNDAVCILRLFLATQFEGGRHSERIKMIEEIENENMK